MDANGGGTCYEDAGKLVAFTVPDEGAVLVHGTVFSIPLGRRIDHAWVVLPKGITIVDGSRDSETLTSEAVVDLTLPMEKRMLPKALYYQVVNAEEDVTYRQDEARAQILCFHHWGPWHLGGKDGTGRDVAVE